MRSWYQVYYRVKLANEMNACSPETCARCPWVSNGGRPGPGMSPALSVRAMATYKKTENIICRLAPSESLIALLKGLRVYDEGVAETPGGIVGNNRNVI